MGDSCHCSQLYPLSVQTRLAQQDCQLGLVLTPSATKSQFKQTNAAAVAQEGGLGVCVVFGQCKGTTLLCSGNRLRLEYILPVGTEGNLIWQVFKGHRSGYLVLK